MLSIGFDELYEFHFEKMNSSVQKSSILGYLIMTSQSEFQIIQSQIIHKKDKRIRPAEICPMLMNNRP